jgi:hypothetical protein
MPIRKDSFSHDLRMIKYKPVGSVGEQIRKLNWKPRDLPYALSAAQGASPAHGLLMARGILDTVSDKTSAKAEMREMIRWGCRSEEKRHTIVTAFLKSEKHYHFVVQVAALPRQQTQLFIQDYFAKGGTMRTIVQVLAAYGVIIRKHCPPKPDHAGSFGDIVDWIEDRDSDAWDQATEAVSTLVYAVIAAGKSLVDVISEAAKAGGVVEQIERLVESLIAAGKKASDILSAALANGMDTLKRFASALASIKREITGMVSWMAAQGDSFYGTIIQIMKDAGAKASSIVTGIYKGAKSVAGALIQKMIDVGYSIRQILNAIAASCVSMMQTAVTVLFAMGKTIRDIIRIVAFETMSVLAGVFRGLIAAGKTVAELMTQGMTVLTASTQKMANIFVKARAALVEIVAWAYHQGVSVLQQTLIGILQAGKSLADVLKAVAVGGPDMLKGVVTAAFALNKTIGDILAEGATLAISVAANVVDALLQLGYSVVQVIEAIKNADLDILSKVGQALLALGKSLVTILDNALTAMGNGVIRMVKALISVGKKMANVVMWGISQGAAIMKMVVQGILETGKTVAMLLSDILSKGIDVIKSVVGAIHAIGYKTAKFLEAIARMTVKELGKIMKAMKDTADMMADFIGYVVKRNYSQAKMWIEAALRAGIKAGKLLEQVASDTYFVIRKMVNGIIKGAGKVVDVLEWAWKQKTNLADDLWRHVISALKYAGATLAAIMDWAYKRGVKALQILFAVWEEIGENLENVYRWVNEKAAVGGDALWETIGVITHNMGNSITYVFSFLAKDLGPALMHFVTGLLKAGVTVLELLAYVFSKPLAVGAQIVQAMFDQGIPLGQLLADTAAYPDRLLQNMVAAIKAAGKSVKDMFQAIVDLNLGILERVVRCLKAIGAAVSDILSAIWEVSSDMFGLVVAELFNLLASYRPLTGYEKTDLRHVFGKSINVDKIYISLEDTTNDIVFAVQDFCTKNPASRAFTTGSLINFDPGDNNFNRHTLVHEAVHVWQAVNSGMRYMGNAIAAQTLGAGYNYGYTEGASKTEVPIDYDGNKGSFDSGFLIGEGAETTLKNGSGNLADFNEEQQGQIVMHYFTRRFLLNQTAADYAEWKRYALQAYAA